MIQIESSVVAASFLEKTVPENFTVQQSIRRLISAGIKQFPEANESFYEYCNRQGGEIY